MGILEGPQVEQLFGGLRPLPSIALKEALPQMRLKNRSEPPVRKANDRCSGALILSAYRIHRKYADQDISEIECIIFHPNHNSRVMLKWKFI